MQNQRFSILAILFPVLSHLGAQTILQQGVVRYQMVSAASFRPADTASFRLLFAPQLAALSGSSANDPGTGTFLVMDYARGQSQGFVYANGDTTPTSISTLLTEPPAEKRYKLELFPAEKRLILGYACTRFTLTPKGAKKSADRISGWLTERIRTPARPVMQLNNELPGFPLEISLRDGSSGATVSFTADQITPLVASQLSAYQQYMQTAGLGKEHVNQQAARVFYGDSSVRLQTALLPGWKVVERNYHTLYLRHDGLKATLLLQRKTPAAGPDLQPQLEKLVIASGRYLEDVLHLPAPALDTLRFRGQPAVQRTWRYSNGRNYIFHTYSREENPYNYFPLTDLVEMQRAFLMKNVLFELQIQTIQTNYTQVLQAAEDMLEQAVLLGQ